MRHSLAHSLPLVLLSTLAACGRSGAAGDPAVAAGTAPATTAATAAAARSFLASLPDSTRAVATRPFDDADRTRWFVIPTEMISGGRSGLMLGRMGPAQREAAFGLLGTALSADGLRTAREIIANETFLGQLEVAAGTNRLVRDPERYFVTVFGTAGGADPWGWTFEGHHVSVNVNGVGTDGSIISPLFFGSNPHRIPSGPRAGSRLLAGEEDVARELLAMLSAEQRAQAVVSDTTFGDIVARQDPRAFRLPREGLAAAAMTPPQQAKLRQLMEVYSSRMQAADARAQWRRIEAAGFGQLRFVWAGTAELGKPHYYRVQGPTVLLEYDNTQNNANHAHTVWRDLENDFGGDLLKKHYQKHKH